jgi:3-oxoacyl-[acyl-carrier-protein] synthase-3
MKQRRFNVKPVPVRIKQVASYVPEQVINNDEIMRQLGHGGTGTLLYRAVGSKEKRVAEKEEMGSDMLAKVGLKILQESNVDPATIDKLICSCDPPDQAAPDTAVVTQTKMGLTCPAFGVSMSCVGWLCGINIASGFLASGDRRILVLSASTVGSKYFFRNPMHRAIFGDGAGGILLEREEDAEQIIRIDLLTLGRFYRDIFAPNPWTTVPDEIPHLYRDAFFMKPDNKVFFDALDKYIYPFYRRQFEATGVKPDDISLFIIHQASMPLFNYTVDSFKIPRDKVVDSFSKYGNTISAELPILLDQELRDGHLKGGDLVYFLTYGAGFTAGAMIARF